MEHEGRCVGNRVNAYTSDMDFHGDNKLSKLTYVITKEEQREPVEKYLQSHPLENIKFYYVDIPNFYKKIFKGFMYSGKLLDYPVWYADYEELPQTPYRFSMWQYSSTGSVPGIEGNVDLNIQLLKK